MAGDLSLVQLTLDDTEPALRLSREAGWNQTASDWQLMITAGHTVGLVDEHEQLVATVAALHYGEAYVWLAMLLVATSHRKRGLGNRLFTYALDYARQHRAAAVLDATPAGERLYRKHGFVPLYGIHRMVCDGRSIDRSFGAAGAREAAFREAAGAPDADGAGDLIRLDRQITTFDRGPFLSGIIDTPTSHIYRIPGGTDPSRTSAVGLIRDGMNMRQIGPIYAEEDAQGALIVDGMMADSTGKPLAIDVPEARQRFLTHLESSGFVFQRPFTRMIRDAERGTVDFPEMAPSQLMATAGPEYG